MKDVNLGKTSITLISLIKSPCEGRNLQGIACVTELDLSPKPFSNLIWAVTLFMGPMKVIMGYEYYQQSVGYILMPSDWSWITLQPCRDKQCPSRYSKPLLGTGPIIVVNRTLMNIIKCCFLGLLTSLLNVKFSPSMCSHSSFSCWRSDWHNYACDMYLRSYLWWLLG